jgi:ABC-type spermidine/putrescine transport system permease subunit II
MEDVRIFYGHLVHFAAIWCILWPFGIFVSYLVYSLPFWYVVARKIWQPWSAVGRVQIGF